MQKTLTIRIRGKVQGVWFRASTKQEADRLGLYGFVRNEPDGSVYIEVEGKQDLLQSFVQWCKKGPPLCRVDNTQIEETTRRGFHNFVIQR